MTEIPLLCHEGFPSLILQTRIIPIKIAQELITVIGQSINSGVLPHQESTIEKMLTDADIAHKEFKRRRSPEYLEQAISQWQTVAEIVDEDDPRLPLILNVLGASLIDRFKQLNRSSDLDDAIERLQLAVNLTPDDDTHKPAHLCILGNAFTTRFERFGNIDDIKNAISIQEAAINLTPDEDPNKPTYLSNLGSSLHIRFEKLGNSVDIDCAMAQIQKAIGLTSDGHPDKPRLFSNLGGSLRARFERFGNITDIDDSIAQRQMAVILTPDDHPNKPGYLSNLGVSLKARFRRLGNLADFNGAVIYQQQAVKIISDDDPNKPSLLINLGNTLRARFQQLGDTADLDNAMLQFQSALKLIPNDHPGKSNLLTNLGNCFYARFQQSRNLSDLGDAIEQDEMAVNLAPDDHVSKPRYLGNLGDSLAARFRQLGNPVDIDSAIEKHQKSVDLTQDDNLVKADRLRNLGISLRLRFLHLQQPADAEAAIFHLSAAAMFRQGSPAMRFKAAEDWVFMASLIGHASLLDAYECAIALMPLVAWLGLPIADRHQHLVRIGGLARNAAAVAISFGQYDKALEWLEQGRSIVWTQILQLRTPVDQLRDTNPDLADRFLQVSRLLDHGTQEGSLLERNETLTEEQGRQYRALVTEWESIIGQVRSIPDFGDFLRPPNSPRLKEAACNGPVVVVNIAEIRCDALALLPGFDEVVHIPLPNISSERVTTLRDELKDQLYSDGIWMRGDRAARRVTDEPDDDSCSRVLAELWNDLVRPVLDSLAFSVCYAHWKSLI
jgi:tetratricopeptide (TPR) repeat protein